MRDHRNDRLSTASPGLLAVAFLALLLAGTIRAYWPSILSVWGWLWTKEGAYSMLGIVCLVWVVAVCMMVSKAERGSVDRR